MPPKDPAHAKRSLGQNVDYPAPEQSLSRFNGRMSGTAPSIFQV